MDTYDYKQFEICIDENPDAERAGFTWALLLDDEELCGGLEFTVAKAEQAAEEAADLKA